MSQERQNIDDFGPMFENPRAYNKQSNWCSCRIFFLFNKRLLEAQ